MAAGAGLVFTRYQALMKDSAMRLRRDEVLLRLWGIGPCLRFMVTVSFAQTLETLYSAGVPILRALDISAAATDNLALQTAMREAREEVQAGEELHVALARARFFPPGFLQILAAGGQSGDVPGMLEFAAKMSQQEIENRIAAAIAAIEPAMLLVMGLMVGSMVIAVISPLLKVLEALTL
jgi:general secretion pathway protein F